MTYGYSPTWDCLSRSLFLVDLNDYTNTTRPNIFRYDYKSKKLYSATINGGKLSSPSFILPIAYTTNTYVVSIDRHLALVSWDGVSTNANVARDSFAVEESPIYSSNHFDNGKVDPEGRLVAGTYRVDNCVKTNSANCSIYLFRKNKDILTLVSNLSSATGMEVRWKFHHETFKKLRYVLVKYLFNILLYIIGLTWNYNSRKVYYADACNFNIVEFEYSPLTGGISKNHKKKNYSSFKRNQNILLQINNFT